MTMTELLTEAVKKKATDLHLQTGRTAFMRIDGELISCPDYSFSPEVLRKWLYTLGWDGDHDGTLSASGGDGIRYRIQLAQEQAGLYADVRVLYPLSQLQPDEDEELLHSLSLCQDGIILLCGPTGCGKTTALWRMIQYLNSHQHCHIITLEDPIEIVLPGVQSLITQRELKRHFADFPSAVRQALRQDPDVILVGEMRDMETMDAALTAAETGHLVLSTLHTRSAAQAVTRFVGAYPGERQDEVRYRLSMVLQAILAQQRWHQAGQTHIIREILLQTPAVCQLIRSGREHQLQTVMQLGAAEGMRTMEQAWNRCRCRE